MNAAISARLSEVTMATLERLGFLFASRVKEPTTAEEPALETVRVDFTGVFTGSLELSLSTPVMAELAANMLGSGEGTAPSADEQRDALKELANVVCGNLLPGLAGGAEEFTIRPPYLAGANADRWEDTVAVSDFMLENGICRVRMRVEGPLPRSMAEPSVEPSRLPEQRYLS